MSELIPPLVLELRARATEAVAGMKEARAESSKTAAAFEADAAKMEAEINRALAREREAALQAGESFDEMARRQALAIDKAAGVTARDTKEIDSALARERTAAAETGAAFEESARRQQLAAERSTKAQTAAAEEGSHAGSIAKTALLGAAGAAAFVGFESIKAASSFDAATNVLVTAAGESEKNLGTIRQGIIRIAQETGTSTEQLTEGMYQIEKAGIRGADGLKILDAASKGAKEENADLSTVTNAMTSVMASYGASVGTPVQVMNALKTAAGESKTTMEEFAGALSTVVPIASASHISFDQVGGAIATLTSHGTSAREATQELASTIRNLQAPNNVAVNAMQQLGINVQDVTTHLGQRGLTGTIKLVTDAIAAKMGPQGLVIVDTMKKSATATADLQTMLGKMPPALAASAKAFMSGSMSQKEFKKSFQGMGAEGAAQGSAFMALALKVAGYNDQLKRGGPAAETATAALKAVMGGTIGMNTALMLSGEQQAQFNNRVKAVGASLHDNASEVEGWGSTLGLSRTQQDRLATGVHTLSIQLGEHLVPAFTSVVSAINATLTFFEKHTTAAKVLGAAIGTVLVGALAAYASSATVNLAKSAAGFVVDIAQGVAWVAAKTAQFASAAALYVWYYGGLLAQSVASGAKWLAQEAAQGAVWGAQQAAMLAKSLAGFVVWGAQTVARATATAAVWIAENAAMAAAATAAFIAENAASLGIVAALAAVVAGIVWVATHWHQSWDFIKKIAADAWAWIKQHADMIALAFGPIGIAVDILAKHWSTVWDGIQTAVQTVWSVIQPIFDAIKGGISDVINGIGKVASAASSVGGAVSHLHIPGFAGGVTNFSGGMAWVGEQGPELVSLPGGSSVYSNPDSMRMAGGGGGTVINIHPSPVTVTVGSGNAQEVQRAVKAAMDQRDRELTMKLRAAGVGR